MYFYHRTRDNWVEKFGEDGFDFSLFEFRKRIIGRCDVSRCVPGFKAIAERWTKTFLPCKFRPYRPTFLSLLHQFTHTHYHLLTTYLRHASTSPSTTTPPRPPRNLISFK